MSDKGQSVTDADIFQLACKLVNTADKDRKTFWLPVLSQLCAAVRKQDAELARLSLPDREPRPTVIGASPVCLDCNAAGIRNCSHFDNCEGKWVYKPSGQPSGGDRAMASAADAWSVREQFQRGRLFGQGEGLETAAQYVEGIKHSVFSLANIANGIRELVELEAQQPTGEDRAICVYDNSTYCFAEEECKKSGVCQYPMYLSKDRVQPPPAGAGEPLREAFKICCADARIWIDTDCVKVECPHGEASLGLRSASPAPRCDVYTELCKPETTIKFRLECVREKGHKEQHAYEFPLWPSDVPRGAGASPVAEGPK